MLTLAKRSRTQSSESNETGPTRKLAKLKVGESSDHIEESPQVNHSATAVRGSKHTVSELSNLNASQGPTFNAIGTSGTVTMVAGHIINGDYHAYPTASEHCLTRIHSTLISYSQIAACNQISLDNLNSMTRVRDFTRFHRDFPQNARY